MKINRLVLIETSSPGNLGAALRIAANFGVPSIALVRPKVCLDDPLIERWACGAGDHVEVAVFDDLSEAAATSTTLVATASGRGRPPPVDERLPTTGPARRWQAKQRSTTLDGNVGGRCRCLPAGVVR